MVLIGRSQERARLSVLLRQVRAGRAGALVVRGDAGVGKTALLRHVTDQATDMTVVAATGIEAEAELEFSGLLALCRPLLRYLDCLTDFQSQALRSALGLAGAAESSRFVVGAATLELLAAAAEDRPVLVVVDDAQWLDRASADAVRFAARRMDADRVGFLISVRDDTDFDTAGIPELRLSGLDEAETQLLLSRAAGQDVSVEAARRLHRDAGGNPLALVELLEFLTPDQLERATTGPAAPVPVGRRIQDAFAHRLAALPAGTRQAMLVLAAATDDRLELLVAALAVAGLGAEALEPAESAGLIDVGDGWARFRHPLVRATAYQAADASQRRHAHRCLAEALASDPASEQRTWHLSHAAFGPDEGVAAALAETARRAAARTGYIAAAAALERAARLTPDDAVRGRRLYEAAEAAGAGGDDARALRLADEALSAAAEPAQRAPVLLLKGRLGMQSDLDGSYRTLVEAAAAAVATDPATAAQAWCAAATACMFRGDVARGLRDARRARAIAPRDGSAADLVADYTLGRLLFVAGMPEEGEVFLDRALELLGKGDPASGSRLARVGLALAVLGREEEAATAADQAVALARGRHPEALTVALGLRMHLDLWSGRWRHAAAGGAESVALLRDLGHRNSIAGSLLQLATIDALRGSEASCLAMLDEVELHTGLTRNLTERAQAELVRGQLAFTLGRLEEAAERLAGVSQWLRRSGWGDRDVSPDPDLVEVQLMLGHPEVARSYYERWMTQGARVSPRWAAALSARCAGLLAPDATFAEEFVHALRLHAQSRDPYALARTKLCFGERLRRTGRKREAREQLRAAHTLFAELECTPWAERARRELRATGEKVRRTVAAAGDELTPQELQIALQVAQGRTNKEVAAALFLSPKTIEFHLGRVYRKLDVTSRTELVRRMASEVALV